MTEPILRTTELSKHFGGLTAVNNVSLDFHVGAVHALLGPNGAGKSTLINLLSGDLQPSSGEISLRGQAIEGLAPERVSRLGLGRSYQRTNIFSSLTALENCRLAVQSRRQQAWRLFSKAACCRESLDEARRALALAGLEHRAATVAANMSHGEQRQLEIAMALATRPEVLLLDEPLAGMGAMESANMVALLRRLAPDHAIVLVEHDMDAVFAVADVITVMVNGTVLESGAPAAIRASRAVQEAYLGEEAGHDAAH
jgi:branched-chain amino acid transport system ATP-binding protein